VVESAFQAKVIVEFERGFAHHYALVPRDLNGQTELMSFPLRHLSFGQVLFLFVCCVIRITEPNTSLYDLRFPLGAANDDVHAGDVGILCAGVLTVKSQVNIEPWRAEQLAYPLSEW
jgi:hypothetical protein